MRSKFSELYWGIALLVVFALLGVAKLIWWYNQLFIEEIFGPAQLDDSPFAINWSNWLLLLAVLFAGGLWLTIHLWRRQKKIRRKLDIQGRAGI